VTDNTAVAVYPAAAAAPGTSAESSDTTSHAGQSEKAASRGLNRTQDPRRAGTNGRGNRAPAGTGRAPHPESAGAGWPPDQPSRTTARGGTHHPAGASSARPARGLDQRPPWAGQERPPAQRRRAASRVAEASGGPAVRTSARSCSIPGSFLESGEVTHVGRRQHPGPAHSGPAGPAAGCKAYGSPRERPDRSTAARKGPWQLGSHRCRAPKSSGRDQAVSSAM